MKAIITFHSIDDSGSVLSFPTRRFRDLVARLARSETPPMDLDALLSPATPAGVSLTFDDGIESVAQEALPVLRDYRLPAHLFLPTDHVGRDNRWPGQPADAPVFPLMSWRDVENCHAGGIRIESHSASHADLRTLPIEATETDCARADATIERHVGRAPRYLAYPYGYFNTAIAARSCRRYAGCVTTELRYLGPRDLPGSLPRLDSYYLTNQWTDSLASLPVRGYLEMRSWLRLLRSKRILSRT